MEDEKIVQMYWDRDQRAITTTADKYGNYCTVIARNILGNEQDAEECVNDTYLNAWDSIPPHRPSVLATFLGKITRNLSLNRYKYLNADKRGGGSVPMVLDELSEIVAGADTPEHEMNKKELLQTINQFLADLSEEKRKMFVSRYWYFEDVKSIAKRLKMTENNVSVTLNRLRKQLHTFLSERGFEL
jgi:RNA polymerase sigma-70 factor (ECF subfamily)